MKELQNDYTTPEQSKRLLELSVPADSANYAYMYNETGDVCRVFINHTYTIYSENVKRLLGRKTLPCWSVGRLMEIIGKTRVDMYATTFIATPVSDILLHVIGKLETLVLNNKIDFSKLENRA